MASLRVFALLLVAVFYVTVVRGAAVRPNMFEESLQSIAREDHEKRERFGRGAVGPSQSSDTDDCGSQACGWAIYKQFTRQVQSFISNTCKCKAPNSKCIRTDDDISVSAYVYHCRHNVTEDDIQAPEHAD